MPNHEKWLNQQIQAAVELGIPAVDAERAARFVLENLPPGADPATYILPAQALEQDVSADAAVGDARSAWYAEVDARFARLLDAREVSE